VADVAVGHATTSVCKISNAVVSSASSTPVGNSAHFNFQLKFDVIMTALWNRTGPYIFALWILLLFFSPSLAKNRQKFAICAPWYKFVGLYLRN